MMSRPVEFDWRGRSPLEFCRFRTSRLKHPGLDIEWTSLVRLHASRDIRKGYGERSTRTTPIATAFSLEHCSWSIERGNQGSTSSEVCPWDSGHNSSIRPYQVAHRGCSGLVDNCRARNRCDLNYSW
jgi:hypothetical protein